MTVLLTFTVSTQCGRMAGEHWRLSRLSHPLTTTGLSATHHTTPYYHQTYHTIPHHTTPPDLPHHTTPHYITLPPDLPHHTTPYPPHHIYHTIFTTPRLQSHHTHYNISTTTPYLLLSSLGLGEQGGLPCTGDGPSLAITPQGVYLSGGSIST